MSTSSILFYKNILKEERYKSDVSFPIQFDDPNAGNNAFLNDKWEVKLRHMIELFQVSYYHPNQMCLDFSVKEIVRELDKGNPVS